MITITRRFEFDAAHRLQRHQGKCRSLHGHRYVAEVSCTSQSLNDQGMVIDFSYIKETIGDWIDRNWDHTVIVEGADELMERMQRLLPDTMRPWYVMPCAPTAENMAAELAQQTQRLLNDTCVMVQSVAIWETPDSKATWRRQ